MYIAEYPGSLGSLPLSLFLGCWTKRAAWRCGAFPHPLLPRAAAAAAAACDRTVACSLFLFASAKPTPNAQTGHRKLTTYTESQGEESAKKEGHIYFEKERKNGKYSIAK
ncbi:hypothetical protein DQ04_10331010 [Trypanosoma grayi]|uniref:hypothetical protein n=1 Tax=Trypanosoma grayi TaxID=71804 RepID=UPI0004F46951|nr:hypothetical protein DQ04_10331010 [Trypanosoma grayi]KEG07276.1 hypothetical protein DQ04_10331010 [Trypanosoma grayi]